MKNLGHTVMIFDGAMGSELVKAGIAYSCPEDLNITHSDAIVSIHKSYRDADFITTNTFGLNRLKYKGSYDIATVARKAIENARKAEKQVFFDIGPTGKLLKPLGALDFDEAYDAFREVVIASRDMVDGYILETFSDLYELKAALLAVKENADKPIFATMTFDKSGRTLTGTSPEIMVAFLEEMGVDALGVNCSLGPNELYEVARRVIECASTPVILQPNRGIPRLQNGETVYDLTLDDFVKGTEAFADMGASVLGGCCGTSPEFIKEISKFKGREIEQRRIHRKRSVASYARLVEICEGIQIDSITLCADLSCDECEDLAYEVLDLADDGAEVLEIRAHGIEAKTLRTLLEAVQGLTAIPLMLSSEDQALRNCFARYYNGTVK